jgi:hypothetical protein
MNKLIVPLGIVLVALAVPALAVPAKPVPVPEPSSLSILASAAAALGGTQLLRRWKRKNKD